MPGRWKAPFLTALGKPHVILKFLRKFCSSRPFGKLIFPALTKAMYEPCWTMTKTKTITDEVVKGKVELKSVKFNAAEAEVKHTSGGWRKLEEMLE